MIYNEAIFNKTAKDQMLNGIKQLAKAVKSTLGPNGKNCIIEVNDKQSIITKDGVTVAKNFFLKEGPEKIGANLVKEVASRAAQKAGDGTTTAIVLAEAIFEAGLKALNKKHLNVNQLKLGIDNMTKQIVDYLKTNAIKIDDYKQIVQIATISANNDESIGKIIADAIQAVGIDGTVTVEPSQTTETFYSIVEGMQFTNGFLSPYFINNQEAGTVEFENPFILMYGKKIATLQEILPALQAASQQKSPLLIIADEIEQEVLTALVVNKVKGVLSVAAVKSPGFGEIRKEIMQDIAALTDGTYVDEDLGMTIESCKDLNLFGTAKKVKISQTDCTIIGSSEIDKERLEKRITKIKDDITNSKNEALTKNLKRRLSKLTNGVAVIHVGASSTVELGEKKDRIDDALCATRAAIEEGIVTGGGSALLRSQLANKTLTDNKNNESYITGQKIILDILNIPFKTILENAGFNYKEIYDEIKTKLSTDTNNGWNALTNEYVTDMYTAGIIDPVKVTRTALESAASVAGLLLTTECVMMIKEEPDKNPIDPRLLQPQQ
jgi:chaperonin GroEL